MAGTNRGVTVIAKLLGGRKIETETDGLGKSIKGLGTATEEADKKAGSGKGWELFSNRQRKAREETEKTHHSLRNVITAGAGLAAGYLGVSTLTSAVNTTSELTKGTRALNQATGMGLGSASRLMEIFSARGIDTAKPSKAFTILSKGIKTAQNQALSYETAQGKALLKHTAMTRALGPQAEAFKLLGISQGELKAAGNNLGPIMTKVTERLGAIHGGATKMRLATTLLGKGWQSLQFLLGKGAMGQQLKMAKEFFPDVGGGNWKQLEAFRKAQIESGYATKGLQVMIGIYLVPVLTKVMKKFIEVTSAIEHGKGPWRNIEKVLGSVIHVVSQVVTWFSKTKLGATVLASALTILVGLWAVSKILKFVEAIKLVTIMQKLWAGATWLVNAALDANPVVLIIGSLLLLGVAVYEVVKHFKFFEKIVVGVWSWIKQHWKQIFVFFTGPFGLATLFIVGHFNQIVNFVTSLPGKLASAGKGMWDWIKDAFRGAIDWILKGWNALHFHIPGFGIGPVHFGGFNLGLPQIPLLAEGGTIRRGGSVVVGDRGPEILSLPPGARVDPLLPGGRNLNSILGGFRNATSGDLHVHVELDRREIALAVIKELKQYGARGVAYG